MSGINICNAPRADSATASSQAVAALGEAAVRHSAARFGGDLRAIILTGSLARNEGTFLKDGDRWRLLGDADFFLVHREGRSLSIGAATEALSHEIEHALLDQGLVAHIGLSSVYPSYLRDLPPHIATYELRACGRVIWGDPGILASIPAFAIAEISLEDAWRMLANRIIEYLEVQAPLTGQPDPLSEDVRYRTVKLFLDMATSYLVFAGGYHPTYRERERALRSLADEAPARSGVPFPLRDFASRVSACTRMKLETWEQHGGLAAVRPEEALGFARLLWRWELTKLTGAKEQLSDRELMFRWMHEQRTADRLRGWISVLRRAGWHRSWREWPRWSALARRASPRYWVYSVAAELLPETHVEPSKARVLVRRLPSLDESVPKDSAQAQQWLAAETARNYRQFLEATRA